MFAFDNYPKGFLMKDNWIKRLAFKLRPDLENLAGLDQVGQLLDVYIVMLNIPLLIIGMAWLISETDRGVLSENWSFLLLLLVIALIFSRFRFELQFEIRPGVAIISGGTLRFIVSLSAVFIFGPAAYWIAIIETLASNAPRLFREKDKEIWWNNFAQLFIALATGSITILTGLWAYRNLGGVVPLPNLSLNIVAPAVVLLLIDWLLPFLLLAPALIYLFRSPDLIQGSGAGTKNTLFFIIFSSALPNLALPFTILGAALYSLNGAGTYLFFLSGALLTSILASRLTDNVQQRSQRARELGALEELGRLIIAAPPDGSTLPEILTNQFSRMFFLGNGVIWLEPDRILFQTANAIFPELETVRSEVRSGENTYYQHHADPSDSAGNRSGLAVPIKNDDGQLLGGVYFRARPGQSNLLDFLPALNALAAQIASALYRAEMHQEILKKERMASELELAGRIQSDFLPQEIPVLAGYEIAASLTPALQTSGDFYDFVPLSDGRLGVLIADVADKGTGAALFMALTRTLIRTYALEHPDQPELVLQLANQRVMADTQEQLFVTTFYGVLDSTTHSFTYVNGGHNPPYLLSPDNGSEAQALVRTGIPIGIMEDAKWERKTITLQPGNVMVFYTDGVTEAQNHENELFDDHRLIEVTRQYLQYSAQNTHDSILNTIQLHVGDAPQFDDLTLIVIRRK